MRSTLGQKAGLKRQVDEAGPGDLDLVDMRVGGEQRRDALGQRARRLAGGLGQHHGGIGGEVAVAGSPWAARA